MQRMYRKIFKMACEELPHRHHVFITEEAVMYRGFKISLKDGKYYWHDTRYTNYYEPVDPLITENVLIDGFYNTITLVMIHNDDDKMCEIRRETFNIEQQIKYWVNKSSENWRNFKKQEVGILSNLKLTPEQIEHKITVLDSKYLRKKDLYIKKRGVLKQEREQLEADMAFYLSRIKSYKNQNYGKFY